MFTIGDKIAILFKCAAQQDVKIGYDLKSCVRFKVVARFKLLPDFYSTISNYILFYSSGIQLMRVCQNNGVKSGAEVFKKNIWLFDRGGGLWRDMVLRSI